MAGVTIAPTTTMFAVAPVPLKPVGQSERPGLGGRLRRRVGGVRMRRGLRLTGGDEHEATAPPARDQMRRERLRRVLDCAARGARSGSPSPRAAPPRSACLRASRRRGGRARRHGRRVCFARSSAQPRVAAGSRRSTTSVSIVGSISEARASRPSRSRPQTHVRRSFLGQPADDGRPEIAGSTCYGDDASLEAETHVATLATLSAVLSSVHAWQVRHSPSCRRSSGASGRR